MTPSQRKRHLVMWAVVMPLAVLVIVLGWFGRTGPSVQEAIDVPAYRSVYPAGSKGAS